MANSDSFFWRTVPLHCRKFQRLITALCTQNSALTIAPSTPHQFCARISAKANNMGGLKTHSASIDIALSSCYNVADQNKFSEGVIMRQIRDSLSEKLLADFGGDGNHAHRLPFPRPSLLSAIQR